VACKKKQKKPDSNIYVNLHDPNDKQTDHNNRFICKQPYNLQHAHKNYYHTIASSN